MSPISIALIILAVTVILFIWEPVPIIVTAIGASIAFAYTGLIDVSDIFAGYNSTTIVLLAGMMVIGSSLFHAGITDLIGEKMVRVTGKSERNIILATLVVSFMGGGHICRPAGSAVRRPVRRLCHPGGCGLQRHRQQCDERSGHHPLRLLQHYPLRHWRVYSGHPVFHLYRVQDDPGYRLCP